MLIMRDICGGAVSISMQQWLVSLQHIKSLEVVESPTRNIANCKLLK